MSTPRGRRERISPTAHAVYRALVDQVLATGAVTEPRQLAAAIGLCEVEAEAALDELVVGDWAGRDEQGALAALYPFSLIPTLVVVQVAGVRRYAMCAIDALGIAPMLDREVLIESICPVSEAQLALTVAPDGVVAQTPQTVVVLYRQVAGPAHMNRCGVTRFFRSVDEGQQWLTTHGSSADQLLTPAEAFGRGREIFVDWYRAGRTGG